MSSIRSAAGRARPCGVMGTACLGFSASDLLAQLHSQGIGIPAYFQAELRSLRSESDIRLLAESIYHLASRAERQGDSSLAGTAYRFLADSEIPSEVAESIAWPRQRARRRLEALGGQGAFGDRAELFLTHFVHDVSDPALMLGMGVAGAAFRSARFLAMSRLAASGFSPTATRFMGSAAGFALEAPAFVMTTRGVHEALGRNSGASPPSLGQEMLSAYMFLGAMKLTGGAADRLHRRWIGAPNTLSGFGSLSAQLSRQVGMLSGIMLSHRAEQELGLRPRQDFASMLGESLATLLHFNVSGRIFHRLAGPQFRNWERAMDLQAENFSRPLPASSSRPALSEILLTPALSSSLGPLKGPEGPRLEVDSESGRGLATLGTAHDLIELGGEPISRILDHFNRMWSLRPNATPAVKLGPEFARRISEWAYAWQEGKMETYALDQAQLFRFHEALAEGQSLNSHQGRYLEELIVRSEEEINSFVRNRDLLSQIVELARKTNSGRAEAEDRSIDRVMHDLDHRPQFLHILMLAANDLGSGRPLEDFYLHQLNPKAGFSLETTIREGISMASAQAPALAAKMGSAALKMASLEEIHLIQGSKAARGLGDILANLVTNAWRYRRSDEVVANFSTAHLPDGSLQISFRDDGIGIETRNIPSLGSHGFRESRVQLSNSHGFGLASVISNLRRLNWGPLWARSELNAGTEFRFEIPAEHLLVPEHLRDGELIGASVSPLGHGPNTRLENNLEKGFVVPAASLDLAVEQLLREVPPGTQHHIDIKPVQLRGLLRHRRLEILHRLLAGGKPLQELRAIENGSSVTIDGAFSILRLGSELVLKEPDTIMLDAHARSLGRMGTWAKDGHVRYLPPHEIDHPFPSDIVYWPNPSLDTLQRSGEMSLGEYLGRDVVPGGYLVLQTDHPMEAFAELKNLRLDHQSWEEIYNAPLPHESIASNQILPSAQSVNLHLQIYRRRP